MTSSITHLNWASPEHRNHCAGGLASPRRSSQTHPGKQRCRRCPCQGKLKTVSQLSSEVSVCGAGLPTLERVGLQLQSGLECDRFSTVHPVRTAQLLHPVLESQLQGHLNRMEPQIAILPFFRSLEHQRQRHHRTIQAFKRLTALGWSCRAGPPTRAKPVSDITVSTMELDFGFWIVLFLGRRSRHRLAWRI